MLFTKNISIVIAYLLLLHDSSTTTTTSRIEAFVPHRLLQRRQQQQQQQQQLLHLKIHNVHHHNVVVPKFHMIHTISTINRYAKLDDDDEDDDDDDDDDDEQINILEPLAAGVNSVSWLPSVKTGSTTSSTTTVSESTTSSSSSSSDTSKAELIPLFPLGGIVYTPNSQHTLNIFEPRYREMYTDILMNGTKRFAVAMSHPTEAGTFAQMAVLFELEDLKEVSERTADQIKYICNHRVTGRVKLHRVLNPQDWETRSTYLRAEGTVIDDSGKYDDISTESSSSSSSSSIESSSSSPIVVRDIENPIEQKLLRDAFADLVELQHELEEDVRFTRASVLTLAVKPGSKADGLWQTIKLWQSFADQRLLSRQNELQQDFQTKLQNYLKKEKGLKGELPSAIGFQDLSAELQKEVIDLQKRMAVELQPLVLESTLTMQKILECSDHTERLKLLRHFVEAETKRLTTKKAIQSMFSSNSEGSNILSTTKDTVTSSTSAIDSDKKGTPSYPPEEQISSSDSSSSSTGSSKETTSSSSPPSFFSDDDAFQ